MPHAGEFITDVNSTSILMGLATSSHKHLYELKFSAKPWGGLFHEVVCGDDPELKRGKPDPDIFLLCADRLSVAPERCIVFEDSPNGIKAARAAGMQVIAINSPYVEKSDLSEAALIIDSFREMQSLMQSWAD